MKYVAYYRVSTDKQGANGLGMDAQRTAVERFVAERGARVLDSFTEVQSGKRDDRPELVRAIRRCRTSGATLLVAKLDRLSRDATFIGSLQRESVDFTCADMPEANRLTIGLLALIAEHERDMISARTKAGLAEAKKRGVRLGNPNLAAVRNSDTTAATAARSAKAQAARADLRAVIAELEEDAGGPMSLRAVADALNEAGYTGPRGGALTAKQVQRIRQPASRAA